ncbi:MAG: hypothetical protein E7159_03760 [Firmicutes bacterium]|nr:hypothetical protein [Bacillota bacterium]
MKKKLNLIIFAIFSLFVLKSNVYAVSCGYSNYDNSLAANKYKITFDVDDKGNVSNVDGLPISNWENVKDTFISGKKCPSYSYVYNSKLYLYYDYDQMIADATEKKATILNSLTYAEDTGDTRHVDSAKEELTNLNTQCKNVSSMKFDYTKCWAEGKVSTKYTECKNEANAYASQIRSKVSEINGYVSSGYISKDDSTYSEMQKNCASALTNIGEYQTALNYASCNDFKKAMGVNIDCDSGNEGSGSGESGTTEDPTIANVSDALEICDANENPKVVASFRLVGIFVTIIKIIAPIVIIIMGMFDMSKAVLEGKDDSIKKQAISLLRRAIACVLIFFVPSIILALFHYIDGWDNVKGQFSTCMDCILGSKKCPNVGFGANGSTGDSGHVMTDEELVEETKRRARERSNGQLNPNTKNENIKETSK